MKKLLIIIGIFLITPITYAHQPRIVRQERIIIENPEISQAFYGELIGEPHWYEVNSDKEFELYLGVLVPDVENINKDISFIVYRDGEILWGFDGLQYDWTYFWEEFGGDGYYEGPELRSNEKNEYPIGVKVEGGKYEVEVYSPDNMGKYVLAVGTIESFPLNEIINTVKTMPKLKSGFFEKSSLTAFNNKIGMFIFGPAIILLLLIGVIIYLMKRKK